MGDYSQKYKTDLKTEIIFGAQHLKLAFQHLGLKAFIKGKIILSIAFETPSS